VGTTIDVSAAFTDPGVLDTHTRIWAWGDESTSAGKATFGLVSKYKKAANTPTAESEFQFRVADLNFHCGTRQ